MKSFFNKIGYSFIRVYDFIRYDIVNFIRNVWVFRKALIRYRWYEGGPGTLRFMKCSFEYMAPKFDKLGNGKSYSIHDSVKSNEIMKMWRSVKILDNSLECKYVEMAESQLGKVIDRGVEFKPSETWPGCYEYRSKESEEDKEHNRKVFQLARTLEESQWREFCDIIRGQDYSKFDDNTDFESQYDGTGLRNWWD